MRAAKVQASLHIRAVSPEPSLLAHTSSESRGTFRQKARSLAPLNGWACAVKVCHDGMLEDTNSLDGAHLSSLQCRSICDNVYGHIDVLKVRHDGSISKVCGLYYVFLLFLLPLGAGFQHFVVYKLECALIKLIRYSSLTLF